MIKVEQFLPDRDALKDAFTRQYCNYVGNYGRISNDRVFNYSMLIEETQKTSKLEEFWLNPNFINRIDVRQNKYTKEKFLRLYLKDGKEVDVKGNSVQEFMLKNIVLGDEV